MKKITTIWFKAFLLLVLCTAWGSVALAQYTSATVETGGLYTAVTRDNSNNIYVTRAATASTYEVEVYTGGTVSPTVLATGLTHEAGDFPWGLAVTSTGNIFISTDFTSPGGSIIELVKNGSGYNAPITYQTGHYVTALAVDVHDNLYTAEYDAVHKTYAVVKYPANSAPNPTGTNIFDQLSAVAGYTYPTGLAVSPNGDVYVADGFSNTPSLSYGGQVYKLTASSSYASSVFTTGKYTTALAFDLSGNLYSSEISGSGYAVVKYSSAASSFVVYTGLHTNSFYYPWGLAIVNHDSIFAGDGDDHVHGGSLFHLTASTNANLSFIYLRSPYTALTKVTGPDYLDYTASVANNITSLQVQPTASDPHATITVNGTAVASGAESAAIALTVGSNVITTVITSQDGTVKQTCVITVTRAPSTNANLNSIYLRMPFTALTQVSGPDYLDYTASVAHSVTTLEVQPTATDPTATITVNGTTVASGAMSSPITLAVGNNVITTVITAQDGVTKKTCKITVTRAGSSNANLNSIYLKAPYEPLTQVSGPDYLDYTASAPNSAATIEVVPNASDLTATITVNGATVASGGTSSPINLAEGATTTIIVVITAQDGVTKQTCKIAVTRAPSSNANLSSIYLRTPFTTLTKVSGPDYLDYTASVANSVTSLQVQPTTMDPNATVTVNGTAVASGAESSPVALAVGSTVITTIITAQDGVTAQTCKITVTRAASEANPFDQMSVTQPTDVPEMADDVLVVHRGVTPNGDGIDDHFVIDGILAYPDNKLTIMNRNGQLVYEATGYDNTTKTFDGHSNKTGQMQLPGTYFFALDYTVNGIIKHKTGFLVLKY